MNENTLNPLTRAPLQESRGLNVNRPLHAPSPHSNLHKPGQENGGLNTFKASLAPLPLQDDKNASRKRIALQQKPLGTSTKLIDNSAANILKAKVPATDLSINSVKPHQLSELKAPQENIQPKTQQDHVQSKDQRKKPEYGSPGWIQNVIKALPTYKFYFDSVDPAVIATLSKHLLHYHATITNFFSSDVTHVVTTNPIPSKEAVARANQGGDKTTGHNPLKPHVQQASNILIKALGLNMKVWTMQRINELLTPLVGQPVAAPPADKNLKEYLLQERAYGLTTTQNGDASRSDYHIFKGNFVLVEDTTGYYQTIMAHEFSNNDKLSKYAKFPWPKIYVQPTERSPFLYMDERKLHRRTVYRQQEEDANVVQERKDEIAKELDPKDPLHRSPSALASGIINSVTSNAVSTTSNIGRLSAIHGAQNVQERTLEKLGKRVLDAAVAEVPAPTPAPQEPKRPEFLRPAVPVKVNLPSPVAPTSHLKQVLAPVASDAIPHQHTGKTTTIDAPAGSPIAPLKDEDPAPAAMEPPAPILIYKEYIKQGYCENCRGHYDDLNKHIESPEHRRYAHDSSKFAQLDKLLAHLQRKPKKTLAATEKKSEESNSVGKMTTASSGQAVSSHRMEKTVRETLGMVSCKKKQENMSAPPAVDQIKPNSASRLEVPCAETACTVAPKQFQASAKTAAQVETDYEQAVDDDDVLSSEMSRLEVSLDQEAQLDDCGAHENQGDANEGKVEEGTAALLSPALPLLQSPSQRASLRQHSRLQETRCLAKAPTEPPAIAQDSLGRFAQSCLSENMTSQLETDATQPDDRFLDGSLDAVSTDHAAPIQLALSMTSVSADELDNARVTIRGRFLLEGSSETDKEGSDDIVSMVKSPSAGRGVFPRVNGPNLKYNYGVPMVRSAGETVFQKPRSSKHVPGFGTEISVPVIKSPSAGRTSKGNVKRKMEMVMAEERAAAAAALRQGHFGRHGSRAFADTYSPSTPRPQDHRSIKSTLQQHNSHGQTESHQLHSSWAQPPVFEQLPSMPSMPAPSSPDAFEYQQESLPHTPQPPKDRRNSIKSGPPAIRSRAEPFRAETAFNRDQGYNGSDPPSVDYSGYPSTPLKSRGLHYQQQQQQQWQQQQQYQHQELRQQLARHLPPPPQPSQRALPTQQHLCHPSQQEQQQQHQQPCTPANDYSQSLDSSPIALPRGHHSVGSRPTSPTSPIHGSTVAAYSGHGHNHGSGVGMGSGSGYSSPTARSPSRRKFLQHYSNPDPPFPVMSHAEQEEERCYHHYRGNQLPEPVGQKKMKTSSSLEEEFEEYGEGCEVYFE